MQTQDAIFHQGELAIQNRLGVAEKMDRFGRKVIRDHMPRQHQDFYQQLPFIFAGHQDDNGHVWASILTGNGSPGFITSSDNTSLTINSQPMAGDPLASSLAKRGNAAQSQLRLGLLGIELHTRRRNRLSAEVTNTDNNSINLRVLQSFGNCPQYIQDRELIPADTSNLARISEIVEFDPQLSDFIGAADTFFVASSSQTQTNSQELAQRAEGADISHRGGRPGFIKVAQDNTLLIPDFTGNNHYNTLGNFAINPKAGLLFMDISTGDVLTLTGKVDIVWEHQSKAYFKGAERFWRFKLEKGYKMYNALPWRFKLNDVSPNNLMTGTWAEAEALQQQEQQKHQWHEFVVKKVKDESSSIRSFWFAPKTGVKPDFTPGQHITIRAGIEGKLAVRHYTVSNSPHDEFMRISVKRDGVFSNWLHDALRIGDVVDMKFPSGNFTLTAPKEEQRPLVLLSAGIGITPMVSMLRHSFFEGIRTRNPRSVLMINTFRNRSEMAFVKEVMQLTQDPDSAIKAVWLLTNPDTDAVVGKHYSAKGRLSKDILQQLLPMGRYDFFLCGPGGFIQDTYDMLLSLGVADEDIHTEAFGPSALKRKKLQVTPVAQEMAADSAVVSFESSKFQQIWSKEDGNLLQFAESHGLTPEFGCRGGACGSCKVKVLKGKVTHQGEVSAQVAENEALLCYAMPAENGDNKLVVSA